MLSFGHKSNQISLLTSLSFLQSQSPSLISDKNKRKFFKLSMENQNHIQPEDHPCSTDLMLDLSLSMNNDDDVPHLGSSSNSNSDTQYYGDAGINDRVGKTNENHDQSHDHHHHKPRVFSCNYCQRKFYSSQALGGHQNAHKRERTLAKRHQVIGGGLGLGRCSSMASLPLHGCSNFNHKSLGIQVHSMIHKPASSYLSSSSVNDAYGYGYGCHGNTVKSSIYGHDGWHRLPLPQQPNVGKLGGQVYSDGFHSANENSISTVGAGSPCSNHGITRFNGARKFFPAVEEGILWSGVGGQLKSKQEVLQNIDLSLKL